MSYRLASHQRLAIPIHNASARGRQSQLSKALPFRDATQFFVADDLEMVKANGKNAEAGHQKQTDEEDSLLQDFFHGIGRNAGRDAALVTAKGLGGIPTHGDPFEGHSTERLKLVLDLHQFAAFHMQAHQQCLTVGGLGHV